MRKQESAKIEFLSSSAQLGKGSKLLSQYSITSVALHSSSLSLMQLSSENFIFAKKKNIVTNSMTLCLNVYIRTVHYCTDHLFFLNYFLRILEQEGIHCNMTLLFSFAQVIVDKSFQQVFLFFFFLDQRDKLRQRTNYMYSDVF